MGYIAMVDPRTLQLLATVTAIQTADTDGNPDTTGDPLWTPLRRLLRTRTTLGFTRSKGVRLLKCWKQFFGTDQISFQDCGVNAYCR